MKKGIENNHSKYTSHLPEVDLKKAKEYIRYQLFSGIEFATVTLIQYWSIYDQASPKKRRKN